MRRRTTLALVAGAAAVAVAGGAIARSRIRARGPAIPKPVTGIFPNGMAYVRWGNGPKTLLFIPGGPGTAAPGGMSMRMLPLFRPLVEDGYTAWYVARRRDMPTGHTIADMADDYAGLIADVFGGRVDLVVGVSMGGMIGFDLAARHPERFGHIAIAVAGYELCEQGKTLDRDFARLMSEGRNGEAGALIVRHIAPGLRVPGAARALGAVETARLIPDSRLRMYEGVGHVGVTRDKRFAQDVLEFVRQRPAPELATGAERPTVRGEPVATALG